MLAIYCHMWFCDFSHGSKLIECGSSSSKGQDYFREMIRLIYFFAEDKHEIDIIKFTDVLTKDLEDATRAQRLPDQRHASEAHGIWSDNLEYTLGHDGYIEMPKTDKKHTLGKNVGMPVSKHCFMYRKFLKRDGYVDCAQTYFCCTIWKMPICREDKSNRRTGMSCFEEHVHF